MQQAPERKQLSKLYLIENALKAVTFPFSFLLEGYIVRIIAAIACLLALIRNKGRIQFKKEYANQAISSEFAHNLVFLMGIPSGRTAIVFFVPIYIHFLSGLAEFFISNPEIVPFLQTNQKIKTVLTTIKLNRNYLINLKCKIEIYLFFYSIVGSFFGVCSFINLFILYQFLSIKDKVMPSMKAAQAEVKERAISGSPKFLQSIVRIFFEKYEMILNFMNPK